MTIQPANDAALIATSQLSHLALLTILLRYVDRSSVKIEQYFQSLEIPNPKDIYNQYQSDCARIFVCCLNLAIVLSSLTPAVLFINAGNDGMMWSLDVLLTLTSPRSVNIPIKAVHFTNHPSFAREVLSSSILMYICLGIGVTSGHWVFQTGCMIVAAQQLVFTMLLLLVIPLGLHFHLCLVQHRVLTISTNSEAVTTSTRRSRAYRKRSQSCSLSTTETYPERHPVSLKTALSPQQASKSKHDLSDLRDRIKYLTLGGLILLHVHNLLLAKYTPPHGDGLELQVSEFSVWTFIAQSSELTNCASINLLLTVLAGSVLYYRAKLHITRRSELLNLNVETRANSADETVASDCESVDALQSIEVKMEQQMMERPYANEARHSKSPLRCSPPDICSSTGNDTPTQTRHSSGNTTTTTTTISEEEILNCLAHGQLKTRQLESLVGNPNKAVELRRADLRRLLSNPHALERLPYRDYDYRFVVGQCCEEVIGYIPIPVGKVGPLLLDGHSHYLPLATTEGCLVASTNRGCRALFLSGGVNSVVFRDQMTRAPVVYFPSVLQLVECIAWIESTEGYNALKTIFDRTSGHINLLSVFPNPSGRYLHIRFAARTGDAMGMNMVSKATNAALHELQRTFPVMQVISLSGNMCTDKKPAPINTILGRGKSVIAEATLPATVLAQVLHTTAARLARLAHAKNWTGSAAAGCSGMMGSNAHAANIVAGIFAACGQDIAQVVDSSACMTQFELGEDESLITSVTMPCMEVGTIGGGTRLPAQRACLDSLNLNVDRPTEHFARLIAGTVLAGELSLMAALDTDDLVSAHLRLNRATALPAHTVSEKTNHSSSSSATADARRSEVTFPGMHMAAGVLAKTDGLSEPGHPIM